MIFLRNPLGCAVAMTALDVLIEENLANRAEQLGEKFRSAILAINSPLVKTVRGRGLLNAVVIDEDKSSRGRTAWQLCLLLKSRGVLAKPTHVNMYVFSGPCRCLVESSCIRIRFAPPLVISEEDLMKAVRIIEQSLQDLDKVMSYQSSSVFCGIHPTLSLTTSPEKSTVRKGSKIHSPTNAWICFLHFPIPILICIIVGQSPSYTCIFD